MRVGHAVDAHRFDPARPLILGGVEVPGSPGLAGHSDADVLSHAIADALLGAARLGDLGTRFPATDRWRRASSLEILGETARLLRAAGFALVNVDATVIAERPRLGTHREEMARRVAGALGCDESLVSVKVTSTDGLGFAGRGEGIAAAAVALLDET